MYLGRIVELASEDSLFERPLHPYTVALIAAVPEPDPAIASRHVPVEGELPSALAPPPGCAFNPRCPRRFERCVVERPELMPAGSSRAACWLHAAT